MLLRLVAVKEYNYKVQKQSTDIGSLSHSTAQKHIERELTARGVEILSVFCLVGIFLYSITLLSSISMPWVGAVCVDGACNWTLARGLGIF